MQDKYKLNIFIHRGVTRAQRAMPGFKSVLAFLPLLYAACNNPTPWRGTEGQARSLQDDFFHPGSRFEYWECARESFEASSRAEMRLLPYQGYPGDDIAVEITFWKGQTEVGRKIAFNYHLDEDCFGAGHIGRISFT